MTTRCICECLTYYDVKAQMNEHPIPNPTHNPISPVPLQSSADSHSVHASDKSKQTQPAGIKIDDDADIPNLLSLSDPHTHAIYELPTASSQRKRVSAILQRRRDYSADLNSTAPTPTAANSDSDSAQDEDEDPDFENSALFTHLAYGLAHTPGSALGSKPPPLSACLSAYLVPNRVGLTAGSRAWSKHAHRSQSLPDEESAQDRASRKLSEGWWGTTKGPLAVINEKSLALFWKVMNDATWRNLHWLPHKVLVYEVRVAEGYGLRWSQDQSDCKDNEQPDPNRPWVFRGFLEPTMENGHELGWRHPIPSKE